MLDQDLLPRGRQKEPLSYPLFSKWREQASSHACLPDKTPRDFQEAWRGHSPPAPRLFDTRSFPALGPVLPWSPLTYHVAETTGQEG